MKTQPSELEAERFAGLLSIPEAAIRFRRTTTVVYQMIQRGQLAVIQPPGCRVKFCRADDVDRLIASRSRRSTMWDAEPTTS